MRKSHLCKFMHLFGLLQFCASFFQQTSNTSFSSSLTNITKKKMLTFHYLQIFSTTFGYFLLLPFLSLIILFTCTKPRPPKEIPLKPKPNIVPSKKETKKEEPSPASSTNIKSSKENVKLQEKESHQSSTRKTKMQQQQQQPSMSGVKSKEIIGIPHNSPEAGIKKPSNEKVTTSTEEPKKTKGGSPDDIKQSVHIDTELRKNKHFTNTTVTKGSHEIIPTKSNSKEKCTKKVSEYDKHRGHTPAKFQEEEDKITTLSKIDFMNTHPGTDDEALFRKPTDVESDEDEKKKQIQPKKFNKNDKEKKIDAGMIRKATEYPTMADVVSDWTSEKEVDGGKKKEKGKSKKEKSKSKKEQHEKKHEKKLLPAAASTKGPVKAVK